MKKLFIGIVIFAVISVLVTGVLINIKNKNLNEDNSISSGDKTTDLIINVEEEPEKTIDLYGTYNENDLIVEDRKEIFRIANKDVEIEMPRIKGLKNKTVEDKVNDDIKNRIAKVINKFANNSKVKYVSLNYTITSNFSNVLSGYCDIHYDDDKNNNESIAINYELVNGERLKFEDLFVKDMDFNTLIRKMVYKEIERSTFGGENSSSIYYDKKNQTWLREYYDYEEDKEKIIEDEPYVTENDLNKIMKEFINDKEKNYYFSPTKLNVDLDYNDYSILSYYYLKDIANEVTIYDKYLTKESIYESQDIGMKNLWTCSKIPDGYGEEKHTEYGYATENLYYEIDNNFYSYDTHEDDEEYQSFEKKITNYVIKLAEEKVEEYNKIAKENPKKFYILYLNYSITGSDDLYTKLAFANQNELDILKIAKKTSENPERTISTRISEYITTTNITNKQKVMEYLIDCYRYYNLAFYGSGMAYAGFAYNKTTDDGSSIYDSFEEKEYTESYNLNMTILSDSSTRKLEKSEIQDLTKDELNKAYNEIFARHGHEFKNKTLREYFELCPWYEPIANKSVSLEELSEVERYNIDIIRSVINDKKG